MKPTHTGRQYALFSLQIQMLTHPVTPLLTLTEIKFNQMSKCPLTQSSYPFKVTIIATIWFFLANEKSDQIKVYQEF
jgi:hypothetical protein